MSWRATINDRRLTLAIAALALAGCSGIPPSGDSGPRTLGGGAQNSRAPVLPPAGSGRGGYYQDDGPGDKVPDNLLATPDAEPKVESYSRNGNKPYVVFGKTYVPMLDNRPFKQRGIGSWYGKKFHGQKTSSGEIYDMYKMTAAHPTLPIPSYARVTNLANGNQVIVRVNDRGPFHSGRIIDLSYTAALKLGYISRGSSELEVERLLPEDIVRLQSGRATVATAPAASAPETTATQAVPIANVEVKDIQEPRQPASPEGATNKPLATPAVYTVPASNAPVVAQPAAVLPGAGFYLQLGAYSQAVNAEAARDRLQQAWGSTLTAIEIIAGNGLYRLYGGPFASRAEAADAAQKMQDGGAGKPLVVQK